MEFEKKSKGSWVDVALILSGVFMITFFCLEMFDWQSKESARLKSLRKKSLGENGLDQDKNNLKSDWIKVRESIEVGSKKFMSNV